MKREHSFAQFALQTLTCAFIHHRTTFWRGPCTRVASRVRPRSATETRCLGWWSRITSCSGRRTSGCRRKCATSKTTWCSPEKRWEKRTTANCGEVRKPRLSVTNLSALYFICRSVSSMRPSCPWSSTNSRARPPWWRPWSRRTPPWSRSSRQRKNSPGYKSVQISFYHSSSKYADYVATAQILIRFAPCVSGPWSGTRTVGGGETPARKRGTQNPNGPIVHTAARCRSRRRRFSFFIRVVFIIINIHWF